VKNRENYHSIRFDPIDDEITANSREERRPRRDVCPLVAKPGMNCQRLERRSQLGFCIESDSPTGMLQQILKDFDQVTLGRCR
jgi:hypothetical protein